MGYLIHGRKDGHVAIEDRALAHLQIVMMSKLRKGETFMFSWINPDAAGPRLETMWLHPSSTLRFRFANCRISAINPLWVKQLAESTDSATGLHVLPEPTTSLDASSDLDGR